MRASEEMLASPPKADTKMPPKTPRTCKLLRAALKDLGLPTKGLKADLVARFNFAVTEEDDQSCEEAVVASCTTEVTTEAVAPVVACSDTSVVDSGDTSVPVQDTSDVVTKQCTTETVDEVIAAEAAVDAMEVDVDVPVTPAASISKPGLQAKGTCRRSREKASEARAVTAAVAAPMAGVNMDVPVTPAASIS